MMMSLSVAFVCLVSFLFTSVFMALGEKRGLDREKCSPYECGFEPIGSARSSFSIRFFLVAVLFVVFDVEVVLLMPFAFMFYHGKSVLGVLTCMVFLFILFVGLFHECREGSLEWVNQ
uniref:NADH-ubiquinone oxidoreductase chain 3 n=1 Tax=Mytilus trossulus TaxID=6551 RepID=D9YN75_MYTTR|nr:NADH dehydrogenase subunit 3 [Mytilus trossulus]